jgi:repressor LexA
MTPRQRQVYLWIGRYIVKHHRPPTTREIADAMDISSPNGVMSHLAALEKQGWIVRGKAGHSRAMRLPAVTVLFDETWEPNARQD